MLGYQPSVDTKRPAELPSNGSRLTGYVLMARHCDPAKDTLEQLEKKCNMLGMRMVCSEWDVGQAGNPFRVGLWRSLRRLICATCEPKRMPFTMINFDDFLHQALSPCHCGQAKGLDGIVVSRLAHVTSDMNKGAEFVLRMAQIGKHVVADDNICLSCCHPATRGALNRVS